VLGVGGGSGVVVLGLGGVGVPVRGATVAGGVRAVRERPRPLHLDFARRPFAASRPDLAQDSHIFDMIQSQRRIEEDWFECARRIGANEAIRRERGQQDYAAKLTGVSARKMSYLCRGQGDNIAAIVDPDLLRPKIVPRKHSV
jgi:hypothetical protein